MTAVVSLPAVSPRAIWDLRHPLWLCPFRPFFGLVLVTAWSMMLAWGAFLFLGWPLPAVPGGPFVWHAHELLVGMGSAAVAGFVLTSVPEFTDTPSFDARAVRGLVIFWLVGRLAFWCSGWWPVFGLGLSGLAHLGLIVGLVGLLAPRLWRDPERRHLSFVWILLALAVVLGGFYVDALRGLTPMRWLHALLGVLMALIVVSMSRISMSIVNASIDARMALDGVDRPPYLARPPRRNLALLAIALYTLVEFWQPGRRASAWLALAAMCAVFNLLNDWHVGRALLHRWPLMLYVVYVCMAAGYGAVGAALLTGAFSANAGVHLLTVGAFGLNIYLVICIAGYTHAGRDKNGRAWVLWGAAALMAAAMLRAGAYAGLAASTLMAVAAGLWCLGFVLQSIHMLPVFLRPRADGREGCAGVLGVPG